MIFIHIYYEQVSDIDTLILNPFIFINVLFACFVSYILNTTYTYFMNYENLIITQLFYHCIYIIFIQIKLHLFITHFIKPIKKTSRKDPLQSRHYLNCLQALQHIANLVVTSCWNVLINVFIFKNMQSHFVLS